MIPSDDRGFNLLTARWLALGAAAGATLSLLAAQLGVEGPWQGTALVLAFLALFGSTAMAWTTLESVHLAGHEIRQVRAVVARKGLGVSLMGQNMLAELDSVTMSAGRLSLR